ncbi:MAG: T9SS type A sorting domain-containing protein [Fibrobacteria bacterium]|nr:T9SS type A sorting domain-containing protein [Fibrobacteria bacterium]
MRTQRLIIFTFLLAGILLGTLYADVPKNKSVMMVFEIPLRWGGKRGCSNFSKCFESLVEDGINVVHIGAYSGRDPNYTMAEKVEEAHEYGLWVCGGVWLRDGNGSGQQFTEIVAGTGCDYAVIDDPYDWDCAVHKEPFEKADFDAIKAIGNTATLHSSFPIIMGDANCNSTWAGWGVDGLYSRIYAPGWEATKIPAIEAYQSANPDKFTGSYIWLKTNYADSYFESWFSSVWNKTGNVGLYLWDRDGPGNADVGYGSNWVHRGPYIRSVTGKRQILPVWQNFRAVGGTSVEVQVQSTIDGFDPASVQCFYAETTNKWIRHKNVSATGTNGTKDWVTITAKGLPAGTVMFKITDTYAGNYFRSPRTFRYTAAAGNTASRWTAQKGPTIMKTLETTSLSGNFLLTVQDTVSGLNVASLTCEYSTDGGTTWQTHTAEITGNEGSKGKEVVTIKDVPFKEEKPGVNKLRLNIKAVAGNDITSEEYKVKVQLAPVFEGLYASAENGSNYDFGIKATDNVGVILGSQDAPVRDETMILLRMNGDANDASENGFNGKLYGGAKIEEVDSWKSTGGKEKVLYLDGVNSFVNCGHGQLGRSNEITLAAWIKAENTNTPIILGGHEETGSMEIMPGATNVQVQVFSNPRAGYARLVSAEGSFSQGAWHHIAVTYDGVLGQIYIDGKQAGEVAWNGLVINSFMPFMLGRPGNRSRYFKGYLDDVQLISRALTATEIANDYFSGMYRVSKDGGSTWGTWTKSDLSGTGVSAKSATFFLKGLNISNKTDSLNRVQIAARDIYGHPAIQEYALTAGSFVPVKKQVSPMNDINLFPNPFSRKTTLTFSLETFQNVQLDIYTAEGKIVRTLKSGLFKPGPHSISWNGKDNNGRKLKSGQYIARIKIGQHNMVKKLLMIR